MVYYSKKDYELLGFMKSERTNKKYKAVIRNKKTDQIKYIHFGQLPYEHYRDLTGLDLYPTLQHNDDYRKELYINRHKKFLKKNHYSPEYFSTYYLWS